MIATLALVAAANWQPLFDGKTLQGWKRLGGTAAFAVAQGQIVGKSVAGSPNTFLCTTKMYQDFDLEFDVLADDAINSGVQIRTMSVPGYRDGRVHGYQVEIEPAHRERAGGIYDEERRGRLQDLSGNAAARRAFKLGKWNHFRVLAVGDHLQTWVNGVPCADLRDGMTRWGMIGLQVHGADRTNLTVRWKNLRIKDFTRQGQATSTGNDPLPPTHPPLGGRWLLHDRSDTTNWTAEANPGSGCPWQWVDGSLQTGGGDMITKDRFGDCRFHVEFMTDENGKEGQANGNSGVYLMQSYEVQVLNSAPRGPLDNECGGIYTIKAPDFAMAFRAGQWQTYDIEFHAPWWDGSKKVRNARITVYHNGTLIHKDVDLPRSTAAGKAEAPGLRALRLQDHGNKVRYRNIWVAGIN